MRSWILLVILAFSSIAPASAATFDIQGSWTGGEFGLVTYDITITGDFSGNISETLVDSSSFTSSTIMPLNESNFSGVGFNYSTLGSVLTIGGLNGTLNGVGNSTASRTDFEISIADFLTGPRVISLFTIDQRSFVAASTPLSLTTSEVNAVPIPASGVLLFSCLGFLALRARSHNSL